MNFTTTHVKPKPPPLLEPLGDITCKLGIASSVAGSLAIKTLLFNRITPTRDQPANRKKEGYR
jgi:hypothetical protein